MDKKPEYSLPGDGEFVGAEPRFLGSVRERVHALELEVVMRLVMVLRDSVSAGVVLTAEQLELQRRMELALLVLLAPENNVTAADLIS